MHETLILELAQKYTIKKDFEMNTLLDGRYDHIGIGRHDEDGPNDDVLRGRENYKRVVENEVATMLRRGKIKRFPSPEKNSGWAWGN